ncbi:hypothetical protein [Mesorhizobium sp. IMUNJ 23232]|uniref:hypothetical protein n=1 Tax=Mesorhizobium sp. IMUNJ 23232 TaxID=3376064 RepID=UPI00379F5F95
MTNARTSIQALATRAGIAMAETAFAARPGHWTRPGIQLAAMSAAASEMLHLCIPTAFMDEAPQLCGLMFEVYIAAMTKRLAELAQLPPLEGGAE